MAYLIAELHALAHSEEWEDQTRSALYDVQTNSETLTNVAYNAAKSTGVSDIGESVGEVNKCTLDIKRQLDSSEAKHGLARPRIDAMQNQLALIDALMEKTDLPVLWNPGLPTTAA